MQKDELQLLTSPFPPSAPSAGSRWSGCGLGVTVAKILIQQSHGSGGDTNTVLKGVGQ